MRCGRFATAWGLRGPGRRGNKRLMTPQDIARLADMTELRAAIDALDVRLSQLLAERSALIDRAAEIKATQGLPARISWRVEEVAAKARANAAASGYDPDLAEALWRLMMEHFIAQEARQLGEGDDR